ncbi:hypothetical protein N0V90_007525 [Kalmusia sp. IMI 367209]|nr:hypothetical protein N0V90_007525 [Kalmusia sp. IMI 367209]
MSLPLRRSLAYFRTAFNSNRGVQHQPSSPARYISSPSPTLQPQTPPSSPPPLPLSQHPNETIRLPDGRDLGFATFGDPSGAPAFFFHGSPSCRLEAGEWHTAALNTNVRIIGVDRWGMGLSSLHPSGTLLDWPADILALSHHLGISKFHVFGGSGGGPYALACAKALGGEDGLLGAGVVAGVAPPAAGMRGMALDRKVAFVLNRILPSAVLEKMIDIGVANAARSPDQDHWAKQAEKMIKTFHQEEQEFYDEFPDLKRSMIECYKEAFRQGSKGAVGDTNLILKDWGFGIHEVRGKVRIWNGTGDVHVPVWAARWMAERLPDAVLKEYEGETHLSVPSKYAEEILEDLMGMGK